ncbi:MAG: hypothetical protein H5T59_00930 [Anaerolineae bacterium]|nr:hypothetical protein [Anaerolineae bacterium]
MIRPQTAALACPACGQNYTTRVYPVVDVTETPELKDLLLRGTLNVGICPNCGARAEIATPFLYVDREKELALVLMPQEMGLDNTRQQAIIGDLTNQVLGALPPEQRKAYLLQPRMFFTLKSLMEAVLQADGVTPEMVEAMQAKGAFLNQLLSMADDATSLQSLVKQRDGEVDEQLFAMASDVLQQSAQSGQMALAARAARVREALVTHSTWGQKALAEAEQAQREDLERAQAELLEEVLKSADAKDEELKVLLAAGRPLIDYGFYQRFAERIEAAEQAGKADEAKHLEHLRDRVLRLTEELDREMEQVLRQAGQLLRTLFSAEDMVAAVQEHADELDPLLLQLIEFNVEGAMAEGRRDVAQRLLALRDLVADALTERAAPPVRLLKRLLDTETEEARRALLEENRDVLNYDFLLLVDSLLNDAEVEGDKKSAQTLRAVRAEAEGLMRQ